MKCKPTFSDFPQALGYHSFFFFDTCQSEERKQFLAVQCLLLLWCFSPTVQSDACSHPSAEGAKSLKKSLKKGIRAGFRDISFSLEANPGSVCNLHKRGVETCSLKGHKH